MENRAYNEKSDGEENSDQEEESNATTTKTDNKQVELIGSPIKVCNELCKLETYIEQINNDLCRLISRINNANCLINAMRQTLCESL